MNLLRLCTVLLLFAQGVAAADQAARPRIATIRLRDTSQVVGFVVGLKNGVYEVRTESLGVVRVPEDKISSIVYDGPGKDGKARGPAPAAAAAPNTAEEDPWGIELDGAGALFSFDALLKSIASDPALMTKVDALEKEPALQSVLSDPEVMKAIESGNFAALLNNEKIKALLLNPKVQSLTKEVVEGKQAQPAPAQKPTE